MAGSLASINIRFAVDLKQFSTEMQNSLRQIQSLGKSFQNVGSSLSIGLTAPIVGLGAASLKTFGDIDALRKGLISVMGSAEFASAEFEKLKEVAKLPGLGLEEAVKGSVSLQAAGFSADEARAALLSFGNALATVGKGKRELDLVTLALTQLNNKSGGFGQDLRQLTEQLPQLRGALTNAFGTADTEKISKMGVTGRQVVQSLVQEFEKLPKVSGGINNAFENTSDSLKITLAAIGESINKSLNIEGLLNSFSEKLSELVEWFQSLSPEAQKMIAIVAGIAAAIGPLLLGLGGIVSLIPVIACLLYTSDAADEC
jgi:tape measure domain-containing protein